MATEPVQEPADATKPDKERKGSLVRDYTLITLASLAVVFLLLYAEGPGVWALVPVLIAAIGVLGRWSSGPPLFLVTLVFLTLLSNWLNGKPWNGESPVFDVVLALTILGYVAGHYRLCSAASHAVPPDRRRERRPPAPRARGRWLLPAEPTKRTTAGAQGGELLQFLVTLPVFALVAALLWVRLRIEEMPQPSRLPDVVWQFFVVIWAVATLLLIARGFLGYLGRARASREESLLYLQDQLWTQTRGEQRRIARWLAWARLRAQKKKEG
jgi:hypothetical protein